MSRPPVSPADHRSDLIAAVNCEMRSTVSNLTGRIEELSATPGRSDATLNELRAVAQRLQSLVGDVCDLTDYASDRLEPSQDSMHLRELLDEVMSIAQNVGIDRGRTIQLELDDDADNWFLGDAARLRRAILGFIFSALNDDLGTNLLVSVHPTPDYVHKTTDEENPPAWWTFQCIVDRSNTGPDNFNALLTACAPPEPDALAPHESREIELGVSRTLVEALGGGACVEREAERAVYAFQVPLSPSENPEAQTVETLTPSLNLLVVDDNELNQVIAQKILEGLGHRVTIAPGGAEGVAEARQGGYDAILMDIHMPRVDGFEATRSIRALPTAIANTPIIALTAGAMKSDRDRMIASGFDDLVPKPIDVRELATALMRASRMGLSQRHTA